MQLAAIRCNYPTGCVHPSLHRTTPPFSHLLCLHSPAYTQHAKQHEESIQKARAAAMNGAASVNSQVQQTVGKAQRTLGNMRMGGGGSGRAKNVGRKVGGQARSKAKRSGGGGRRGGGGGRSRGGRR